MGGGAGLPQVLGMSPRSPCRVSRALGEAQSFGSSAEMRHQVKAMKGVSVKGRQSERQRGNKFRGHQLPKLFGVSYTDISPR